jgi:hypothetical protein
MNIGFKLGKAFARTAPIGQAQLRLEALVATPNRNIRPFRKSSNPSRISTSPISNRNKFACFEASIPGGLHV